MNQFYRELIRNFNPNTPGFKKKIISFIVFLIISTIFWFLNSLGEDYTKEIAYPVRYTHIPTDRIESSPLPEFIDLKIKTSGYNLLDFYLNPTKKAIVIDYNSLMTRNENCKYILTKRLKTNILKTLKNVEIQSISPDTISFNYYKIFNKKVPVQAVATYELANGFIEKSDILIAPDSVIISGALNKIETINKVFTGQLSLGEIKATIKRNVALKKIEGITFESYRADVTIPIEQSTERIIEIPLQVNNTSNTPITLIPNSIKLSYKVGLSKYSQITKDRFVASVNYSDTLENTSVLKVMINKAPKDIYELDYTPKFVEFIMHKND